ncbi:hypothetical protein [uncultured Methanobrevibacter sp.]|uniref:hypothetical protein n=1 Tax=uncultured Methanobrevibacter sp. TaxID=253161 RepID=UPI0025D5F46E|nr:hypothetical protein [uncultured Methanobrevibacter sp.]
MTNYEIKNLIDFVKDVLKGYDHFIKNGIVVFDFKKVNAKTITKFLNYILLAGPTGLFCVRKDITTGKIINIIDGATRISCLCYLLNDQIAKSICDEKTANSIMFDVRIGKFVEINDTIPDFEIFYYIKPYDLINTISLNRKISELRNNCNNSEKIIKILLDSNKTLMRYYVPVAYICDINKNESSNTDTNIYTLLNSKLS